MEQYGKEPAIHTALQMTGQFLDGAHQRGRLVAPLTGQFLDGAGTSDKLHNICISRHETQIRVERQLT